MKKVYEKIENGVRWRPVKGWEGLYEVADVGLVRSLERTVKGRKGRVRKQYSRLLRTDYKGAKYKYCRLSKDGYKVAKNVHTLVAEAFLYYVSGKNTLAVVDHINGDNRDNRLSNLQITTTRRNIIKGKVVTDSAYPDSVGVCWFKRSSKWKAQIVFNGKQRGLGYFDCPKEAAEAYMKALKPYDAIECRLANSVGFDRELMNKYLKLTL